PQVPDPVRHRAVPSIHHASRLTAVNEVAWKPVGIGPPGGPTTGTGAAVVGELVVVEATVVAVVDRGEEVGVPPHAAPVRARTVTTTPARTPANGVRFVCLPVPAGCMEFHSAGSERFCLPCVHQATRTPVAASFLLCLRQHTFWDAFMRLFPNGQGLGRNTLAH